MEDYKNRMRDEYEGLCGRLERLEAILAKEKDGSLEFELSCPVTLLEAQAMSMRVYKGCLERRNDIEHAW